MSFDCLSRPCFCHFASQWHICFAWSTFLSKTMENVPELPGFREKHIELVNNKDNDSGWEESFCKTVLADIKYNFPQSFSNTATVLCMIWEVCCSSDDTVHFSFANAAYSLTFNLHYIFLFQIALALNLRSKTTLLLSWIFTAAWNIRQPGIYFPECQIR